MKVLGLSTLFLVIFTSASFAQSEARGREKKPIEIAVTNLQIEAKINPRDIDQIQVGQPAMLRFSAFNLRATPEINGTITRIAADTTTDQRTGQTYYNTRIGMTKSEMARLGEVKLIPGMPVEAFVQTGERSVMSYLIKPLQDQFMRAFREK